MKRKNQSDYLSVTIMRGYETISIDAKEYINFRNFYNRNDRDEIIVLKDFYGNTVHLTRRDVNFFVLITAEAQAFEEADEDARREEWQEKKRKNGWREDY